jgi:thiamine biosynthesis lipoprotein
MDKGARFQMSWFAMGTEWQLAIADDRPEAYLRSVAEEVEAEVERVEQLLSFYRDDSDLTVLNTTAALGPARVDPRMFELLLRAQEVWSTTGGAFDPTIGPLLRAWGFVGNSGSMPDVRELDAAREIVGMQHVALNRDDLTVQYYRAGVELEFGAIGKGYAIDRAVELMRDEFEIRSALIHGGASTIYAIGSPPEEPAWHVAVQRPYAAAGDSVISVPLRDRAVSVSAPHGKWFEQDGKRYGHVLDPRTGYPAAGSVLAVVVTESATESDALSTALLVLGEPGIPTIRAFRPNSFVLIGSHEENDELNFVQIGPLTLE